MGGEVPGRTPMTSRTQVPMPSRRRERAARASISWLEAPAGAEAGDAVDALDAVDPPRESPVEAAAAGPVVAGPAADAPDATGAMGAAALAEPEPSPVANRTIEHT